MNLRLLTPLLLLLFATPVLRAADLGPGHEPQLAAAPDGSVYLVYGRGNDIFLRRSADSGNSFSDETRVGSGGVMALGMRRGPRIATGENAIVVTAVCGEKGGGKDGDLLAFRSVDHGRTWQQPVRVNDVPASAREGLQHLASDGANRFYAVWLDLRTGQTRVCGALSTDGGASWGSSELVYAAPDGPVCQCCQPSVVFLPDGQVAVQFRNLLAGHRDMYRIVFRPGQADLAVPEKLGTGTWPLNACPMDGGALAVGKAGDLLSIWQRQGKIFISDKPGTEQEIGSGMQSWIATRGSIVDTVWITARGGRLMHRRLGTPSEDLAPAPASDPVLLALGPNALCAYESNGHLMTVVLPPMAQAPSR